MSEPLSSRVVIIGAGQAGATAAMALRRLGHHGPLTLVGDESCLPYERPPLSKDALVHPDAEPTVVYPAKQYERENVELRLGARVVAVDAQRRCVQLADGGKLDFDCLILAMGARARRLELLDALGERVHTLRTLSDARRLREQLGEGGRAIVVGAGVVGLEVASSLRDLGMDVDVIDPASRVMGRNAPEFVSALLRSVHQQRGVRLHLEVTIAEAQSDALGVRVRLSDGTALAGTVLIYGVGAMANIECVESLGLELNGGAIVVNGHCETSLPHILAIGDIAVRRDDSGVFCRQETWENANVQAEVAARTLLGLPAAEVEVPWFWTDQCGLNVQFAGELATEDWVMRGDPLSGNFTALGVRGNGVVAAVTVNQGREMKPARMLIQSGASVPRHVLADEGVSLRSVVKKALAVA